MLEQAARNLFEETFFERSLPFDSRSAEAYGQLAAIMRKSGKIAGMADIKIAAIAIARDAQLATGNTGHFAHCGIALIDPFTPTDAQ